MAGISRFNFVQFVGTQNCNQHVQATRTECGHAVYIVNLSAAQG